MEILLKKAKSGDLLVLVRFRSGRNFNAEKLEWVPRLAEVDKIERAWRAVVEEKVVDKAFGGGRKR